jgi:hypothetical protein
MERPAVQGKIDFEEINPLDFMDVIKSCRLFDEYGLRITKVQLEPEGEGVENLISWAVAEIYEAMAHHELGDEKGCKRKSTTAVITARRSLSCLVDWYMRRDGFRWCIDFKDSSEAKAEVLLNLGIIDKLTSRVIKRLIDIRNIAEHRYTSVALEEAEDIVELMRRLYDSLMGYSKPNEMNMIWGNFQYGYGLSTSKVYEFWFGGWHSPCFIMQLTSSSPWVGMVLPISKEHAIVRRAFINKMNTATLFGILTYVQNEMDVKNRRWREISMDRAMPKDFYYQLCKLSGLET